MEQFKKLMKIIEEKQLKKAISYVCSMPSMPSIAELFSEINPELRREFMILKKNIERKYEEINPKNLEEARLQSILKWELVKKGYIDVDIYCGFCFYFDKSSVAIPFDCDKEKIKCPVLNICKEFREGDLSNGMKIEIALAILEDMKGRM